jgi:hypothetical protein
MGEKSVPRLNRKFIDKIREQMLENELPAATLAKHSTMARGLQTESKRKTPAQRTKVITNRNGTTRLVTMEEK